MQASRFPGAQPSLYWSKTSMIRLLPPLVTRHTCGPVASTPAMQSEALPPSVLLSFLCLSVWVWLSRSLAMTLFFSLGLCICAGALSNCVVAPVKQDPPNGDVSTYFLNVFNVVQFIESGPIRRCQSRSGRIFRRSSTFFFLVGG